MVAVIRFTLWETCGGRFFLFTYYFFNVPACRYFDKALDMDNPAFATHDILTTLGNTFYDVVPIQYRTYCALTAKISQATLQHFGIDSNVVSCEVWYADADHNYVIGVTTETFPSKWPGHAICLVEGYLIDAALHHFKREFDIEIPNIVICQIFGIASNVIARQNLGLTARLWWHRTLVEVAVPDEPEEMVTKYGSKLYQRINTVLAEKASLASFHAAQNVPIQSSTMQDQ